MDFSRPALERLRDKLPDSGAVGLVVGDVTTLAVQPGAFDRVFCTLMSNLPTRKHRDATYRLAARALRPSGRFVYCTHHQGLHERLNGEPKSGHYKEGGIYRYNFSVSECAEEVRPFFGNVHARPIRVYLPLSRTLGLPLEAQSRFGEAIPGLNKLGDLVLCTASAPVVESAAGARSSA